MFGKELVIRITMGLSFLRLRHLNKYTFLKEVWLSKNSQVKVKKITMVEFAFAVYIKKEKNRSFGCGIRIQRD